MSRKKSIDPAVVEALEEAHQRGIVTVFDRAEGVKPCPIGRDGLCCRNCFMGPCRLVGKVSAGVCGASIETVTARNLVRWVAAGAAAHSDHGRNVALALRAVAKGEAPAYQIKDERKLRRVARDLGIKEEGRSTNEVALELADKALEDWGRQEGELLNIRRAPPKRQEIWRKLGIVPRGIDREIAEAMHRTGMGTDQDAPHLLDLALKVSLVDGWGGSMLSTDISDILFGTPMPVASKSNFGALKDDEVNVVIHGHEPTLAEVMVDMAKDPEIVAYAKSKGAKGINLLGMCCSGNELLMRHGIPMAGNFLQQELVLATGAVEAFVADYQCIMEGTQTASQKLHTKVITTSPKCKIAGATHIEFEESHATEIAKQILKMAIDNYPNRGRTRIPDVSNEMVVGFSHEYISYMQGGRFRESFRPFNDAIIQGRIRGAVGVVGCNNAHTVHDEAHINIVKELIKNDIAVVTTGCNAVACAKYGLLTPEVMDFAGPGLREVCQAIGIPPVLHLGSCVDNSRILTILTQMAMEGGLGDDISDLPVAGIAPEWMHEKALAIGVYFVASGVYTIFGVGSPVEGSAAVTKMIGEGWEAKVGGKLEFILDWPTMVAKAIAHVDARRKALKLVEYSPTRFARSGNYLPGDVFSTEEYNKGLYSLPGSHSHSH